MAKEEYLAQIQKKTQAIMGAKNILPLVQAIRNLPSIPTQIVSCNGIHLQTDSDIDTILCKRIYEIARALMPWRKGPFYLFNLHIDSEWQSFMKWQLIAPYLNLAHRHIADVGCNNGYYMFEMILHSKEFGIMQDSLPASITGFDPSGLFKCQFDFINHFASKNIYYELLGIEDLELFCHAHERVFDVIFCLGVLYHRYDPINALKILYRCLAKGGEVVLDTLIFQRDEEICLAPSSSYAKMSNVYFIPTISALMGWCERAKFHKVEILGIKPTTTQEQRASAWIQGESLQNFLNASKTCTVEGYQAPVRAYFKLTK